MEPVETNIVIFELTQNIKEDQFQALLKEQGIQIIGMGSGKLRIVTHLDYTDAMHRRVLETFRMLSV